MTVKHTPGPWIDGLDASGIVVVERFSAQTVASLGAISEVSIANAKLIAAAPALADALEAILKYRQGTNDACLAGLFEDAAAALRFAGRGP